MSETTSAILSKWKILSQWSNEELAKVTSINIFETGNTTDSHTKLCALILTTDDEVVYVGPARSMVNDEVSDVLLNDDGESDGNYTDEPVETKVNVLSGLDVKKLEVGRGFSLALTNDLNLFLWGWQGRTPRKIPDSAYICYEQFDLNAICSTCSQPGHGYYHLSGFEFAGIKFNNGCPKCYRPPTTYGLEDSIGKKVVKLIKYIAAVIRCTKCRGRCTAYNIGGHEVNYCIPCNYLPQDTEYYVEPLDDMTLGTKLLDFGESVKVVDFACGLDFFVALTKQNYLVLWGAIDDSKYQGIVYNPSNVIVKAFSCGGNHVAVVSVEGELYTCGHGKLGQLGYKWSPEMGHETLRKVPLEGKTRKVCCGLSSTVCLMGDGSVMCFGSHMKMMSPGVLALNQQCTDYVFTPARIMITMKLLDVVNSPLTNIYFAKTDALVFTWGRASDQSRQPELVLGAGDLMSALADLPATFTFKAPCTQQSTLSPHLDSELYGKKFLSDLTLKLSDGEFPAHRLILHSNSVYFRDTFGETDIESVLDMTHYNPEAYRSLLKYFYQVPPTELNATDLFDLYVLANSYKETSIAQEVMTKLKANFNPETVLPLLRKAKEVNCSEFLEECNVFIQSPEFKHILAEKVSEDLDKALSLIEASGDKKSPA